VKLLRGASLQRRAETTNGTVGLDVNAPSRLSARKLNALISWRLGLDRIKYHALVAGGAIEPSALQFKLPTNQLNQ
jgi:hypothetical protein